MHLGYLLDSFSRLTRFLCEDDAQAASRASDLFQQGHSRKDVVKLLSDEFPNISVLRILDIVDAAALAQKKHPASSTRDISQIPGMDALLQAAKKHKELLDKMVDYFKSRDQTAPANQACLEHLLDGIKTLNRELVAARQKGDPDLIDSVITNIHSEAALDFVFELIINEKLDPGSREPFTYAQSEFIRKEFSDLAQEVADEVNLSCASRGLPEDVNTDYSIPEF